MRGDRREGRQLPTRPLEGDWPYLWLDATYLKVRQNGRIVSVAAIVAIGVNSDGRHEVVGLEIGASEAETFWAEFLRELARRGLRAVKLVVSDAHEGHKAAAAQGAQCHLAALPGALYAQCSCSCRQTGAPGCRGLQSQRPLPRTTVMVRRAVETQSEVDPGFGTGGMIGRRRFRC